MAGADFRGEVVDFYARYRRGYPAAVIDTVVDAFGLTAMDTVIDLGCGTGQLTLPLADRVRRVVAVDPSADMLARGREAAAAADVDNATWVLGDDTDIRRVAESVAGQRIAAVTIGQALHWMDPEQLFPAIVPLLRPGGGVAIATNGTPLWLQDSDWSKALRRFLESWLATTASATCGTDRQSQARYRQQLAAAGFAVHEHSVEYEDDLDLEHLVGAVFSAFSVEQLPAVEDRPAFAAQIREALPKQEGFTEEVRVALLIGSLP